MIGERVQPRFKIGSSALKSVEEERQHLPPVNDSVEDVNERRRQPGDGVKDEFGVFAAAGLRVERWQEDPEGLFALVLGVGAS